MQLGTFKLTLALTLGLVGGLGSIAFDSSAAAATSTGLDCPPQETSTQDPSTESSSEATKEPPDANPASPSLPPQRIRFKLWDGSILIGDIESSAIQIETEFGLLEIPIEKIVHIRPGLQSFPELKTRIDQWVQQLGDRNFQTREFAHRQLYAMGLALSHLIKEYSDGGSAERQKHLNNLEEEIQQLLDEVDELPPHENTTPLDQLDAIETKSFTVMGTIQQKKFTLHTRYGTLVVGIEDLQVADRTWLKQASEIRKNVVVTAQAFMQTQPISTGIRVQRGDRIKIRAEGNIEWTNWGDLVSTPDGLPRQGAWQGFNGGQLIARIGKNGPLQEVGSQQEFVAKGNGTLYLGIAMDDDYVSNKGYTWVGGFEAKIKVIKVQPANHR